MNFRTAMEHYQAGTASEEERRLVEEELEKSSLIAEYLDAAWNEPSAPVEDSKAELKQVRSKLRNRNIVLVATSIVLIAALLMVVLVGAAPALKKQQNDAIDYKIEENEQNLAAQEAQYWDPRQMTYSEYCSDLGYALMAYSELFFPGYEVTGVSASHVDLGTYTLSIHCQESLTSESHYFSGSVEKGTLQLPDAFFRNTLPVNIIANAVYPYYPMSGDEVQRYREKLERLPEYVHVKAAISFPEDITMKALVDFSENSGVDVIWSGIRVSARDRQMLPCGMDAFMGGIILDGINEAYPMFCINGEERTAENLTVHFKSLLRYSADQQKAGTGIEKIGGRSGSYYEDALEYVEENGVKSYGCVVCGSAQALLELLDNGIVTQVYPMDAWIDVG